MTVGIIFHIIRCYQNLGTSIQNGQTETLLAVTQPLGHNEEKKKCSCKLVRLKEKKS